MKTLSKLAALFLACALSACGQSDTPKTKIGIILPIEHQALQEIVAGFTDKLHEIYHTPVSITVLNAQGDMNLQRAMIQQMRDQDYAMIVPVATGVTEMTAAMIHNKPLVSLAADFSEENRQKLHPCNIAVVDDEIPPQKLIEFIHAAYPHVTHLSLIHSTADKIFSDVKATIEAGKQMGIEIKPVMVATLPDMTSAVQSLPNSTEGIIILKDNLIVSGIASLAKTAHEKRIPLFTSDEGSVEGGAAVALGVHERQIGEEGAKLALQVLQGKNSCDIPIAKMSHLTLFVNKHALEQEQQNFAPIEQAARALHYSIEYVEVK